LGIISIEFDQQSNKNMAFLNSRRLRDYPRLIFISTWLILCVNLLFHQGWIGAFGKVIGVDFIVFYETGLIFRSDPSMIYDLATHDVIQKSIVWPSIIPSNNAYLNPPYVAPFFSLLTYLSLPMAYAIWSFLAIISCLITCYFLYQQIPAQLVKSGLTYLQMVVITLSFFPFIEGFLAGQNHWLSLLIVTGILLFTIKERWFLAGMMAGLLLYKPQYVIGFLILWLIWGKYKALISFGIVSLTWIGLYALFHGFESMQTYVEFSQAYMFLPYIEGWPNYLLTTIYGLLTSIFPIQQQPNVYIVSQATFFLSCICLGWLAYILRKQQYDKRTPAIIAALLLPLLATPYALLHDLVILIPGFVLWARYSPSRTLLYMAILTYTGTIALTLMGALAKFALLPFLTIFLVIMLILWIYKNKNSMVRSDSIALVDTDQLIINP
jgi:hypothetical protein